MLFWQDDNYMEAANILGQMLMYPMLHGPDSDAFTQDYIMEKGKESVQVFSKYNEP